MEFTASGDKRSLTAMYGKRDDARPDRTKDRTVSEDGNFAATPERRRVHVTKH